MRNRNYALACLVLMLVIALAEFRAPKLGPITNLDYVLLAAQRAAEGR